MKGVLVKVEDPMELVAEMGFLAGLLNSLDKNLPDLKEMNKIMEQLKPKK